MADYFKKLEQRDAIRRHENQMIMFNETMDALQRIVQLESEKAASRDRYVSLQFENLKLKYDIKALHTQSDGQNSMSFNGITPSTFNVTDNDLNVESDSSITPSHSSPIQFIEGSDDSLNGSLETPSGPQHEGIPLDVCSDEETVNRVINEILSENGDRSFVVGLDCEWTPDIRKFNFVKSKVGLLQLAFRNRIVLIRFSSMKYKVPDALRTLLGNQRILKTGVGVMDDCNKMKRNLKVTTRGVVDIDDIYNEHVGTPGRCNGLKRLYRDICGKDMVFKDKRICLSDWNTAEELTPSQIANVVDHPRPKKKHWTNNSSRRKKKKKRKCKY